MDDVHSAVPVVRRRDGGAMVNVTLVGGAG